MLKTLLTLLLFTLFTNAFGQNAKLYKGTIGKSIKITFYLQGLDEGINADPIVGAYKYDNKKDYILINGFRNHKGNVILTEFATPNFSATFLGTMTRNTIVGKWISADQKSTYPFELIQTEAKKEQVDKFKQAINVKATEFRNY